jgi:hypothetical protein
VEQTVKDVIEGFWDVCEIQQMTDEEILKAIDDLLNETNKKVDDM